MATDLEVLRDEMHALPHWYHQIDLGNGLVIPGRDYRHMWRLDLGQG